MVAVDNYYRYPERMGMNKIELGVSGINVAANVARFRGDMSYAELSRRLTTFGRPIAPLGLRHIEAGKRRVDVDDLAALAGALGISVLALMAVTEHDVRRLALGEGQSLGGIVHTGETGE